MSAPAYALPRAAASPPPPSPLAIGGLRPREGWLSFLLVVFMLVVLAWSLDAADYRGGSLYWLTWVVILGATWGLVTARLGLPRWEGHAIGALIGGLVVIFYAAGQISTAPDLGTRLADLGRSAAQWYRDVAGPTHLSTEVVAWQVTCGCVAWGTAQFASYAVFGHRRPLVAIVVPGVILLVNMVIAASVSVGFLTFYTAAALLLLVRFNLAEQRETWIRRRIGEAAEVGGSAARSGLVVVAVAVVLALGLASIGSSAPLAGLWQAFQNRAQDVALRVNDWFNLSPDVRFHGDPFDTRQAITGKWDAQGLPTLKVSMSDTGRHPYLRGTAYDRFVNGNTWLQGGPVGTDVAAGASVRDALAGDGDLDPNQLTPIAVTVTQLRELQVLLSPGVPTSISIGTRVETLGPNGPFAALRPIGGTVAAGTEYTVTALVPKTGDAGLTKNALRVAGTAYPTGIIARYGSLAADPGAFDPNPSSHESVAALASRLIKDGKLTNPFDIADAFQFYLSDTKNFQYSSDIRGRCGSAESVADCFLRIKEGYCEYYATTMILMLRSQGIPARLAVGYLPPGADGVVTSSAAHAWVQVYFPGHGWVDFDPTGGNGAGPVVYPEGAVVAPTTAPSGGANAAEDAIRQRLLNENRGQTPATGGTRDIGTSLLPIALAAAAVLAIGLFLVFRRRPQRRSDVVAVYGQVVRLARWFGFPPRPAQTVFEYTGALADVVPEARPELQSVAMAKVEATYRPVPLDPERLDAVGRAYRKLRLDLTRLLLRRGRGGSGITIRSRLG